jgi:glycosyltransferase involved in cell wall biosynthesis
MVMPSGNVGSAHPTVGGDHLPESLPLVSVVIPAYNAGITIGDTLRSVRGQTYTQLQILVVDDGSSDETRQIVEQHASEDKRVMLLAQPNSGVAAARNHGWRQAVADFIAFVDADDLWAPTKIEKQMAVMLCGGPDMGLVYTWFSVIDERNRVRYQVEGRHIAGDVLAEILLENFVGHASSPLIRRSALELVGGYSSDLRDTGAHGCEDLLLYQRIAARCHYGLVPEHLTGYRTARIRMSSNRLRMLLSFKMVAEQSRRLHPQHQNTIDSGIRKYLVFLIGEAAADLDARQCWALLQPWIRIYPQDTVFIPAAVVGRKLLWRLKWLGRFFRYPVQTLRAPLFLTRNSEIDR